MPGVFKGELSRDKYKASCDRRAVYRCVVCKYDFDDEAMLRTHMAQHDAKNSMACSKCGRSFCDSYELRLHQLDPSKSC